MKRSGFYMEEAGRQIHIYLAFVAHFNYFSFICNPIEENYKI
jgi:hypothetical protein